MDPRVVGAGAALAAAGGAVLVLSDRSPSRSDRTTGSGAGRIGWPGGLPEVLRRALGARGQQVMDGTPVPWRQLGGASLLAAVAGTAVAYVLFGGVAAPVVGAGFAATFPVAGWRRRRSARAQVDAEAWPRLIEEVRLRTGSLGRSVPQALFEAGRRAPDQWRAGFASAEREWLLTTDFARTTSMLKRALASPHGDVVLETLLMAHEVGGVDLDRWLQELAEDRSADVASRKDAASKQAGVRFARMFVLLVPLGMTLAGLSIGSGRSAYETGGGQIAVVVGILSTAACWLWSGRLMALPEPPRVFGPDGRRGEAGPVR